MTPEVHLSLGTWLIHLSSVAEYGVAIYLLRKYASERERGDLMLFASCMLVHFVGALFILSYHATDDTLARAIDLGRTFNGLGSVSLLFGASLMAMQKPRARTAAWTLYGTVVAGVLVTLVIMTGRSDAAVEAFTKRVFIVGNTAYLGFLAIVTVRFRRDREAFSGLTLVGFWFMFVFVGVSGWAIYQAVTVKGLPTLDHDDFLHGFAEAFLTLSNLLVAIGIVQQRKRFAGVPVSAAASVM